MNIHEAHSLGSERRVVSSETFMSITVFTENQEYFPTFQL